MQYRIRPRKVTSVAVCQNGVAVFDECRAVFAYGVVLCRVFVGNLLRFLDDDGFEVFGFSPENCVLC